MKTNFTSKCMYALFFLILFSHLKIYGQTCPISGDVTVCQGDVESYSTSVTGPGPYTYQWSAFGGVATSSGATTSVVWGSSGSGQVTVIVRDAANNLVCNSVLNVGIHTAPTPVITPSNIVGCGGKKGREEQGRKEDDCYSICDSTWVTYSTPHHSGSTYAWNVTGAAVVIPSTSNTVQVMWTSIGSGTVTVTETNNNGCVGTSSICVKVVGRPTAQFTSLNPIVGGIIQACLNQPIQFIDQSHAGAGSPLVSYRWIFEPGGEVTGSYPGTANEVYAYATPGTKEVLLIVENECHCVDTFKMRVNVSSDPGPDIFCNSTVCPGGTVTYHTSATGCSSYNWSVTNGTIIGSNTNPQVTVVWGSSGPATITLSVNGCSPSTFCNTPTTLFVPLITPTTAIIGPTEVCEFSCYKYRITCDIPLNNITWTIPAGVTAQTSLTNTNEIEVCFYNFPTPFTSGTISVNYYHSTPGSQDGLACGGSTSIPVNSRPRMYLSSDPQICDKGTFNASAGPAASGTITWKITNQAGTITHHTSTLPVSNTYTINNWSYGPGTFLVTATANSGQYCNSPQTATLIVNPNPTPVDTLMGQSPVCPNYAYAYSAIPTASNLAVLWTVQNGSPTTGAGAIHSVTWNATGPYRIGAIQVDPITGCHSDTVFKNVASMLPLASIPPSGDSIGCANGTGTYSISAPGDDYIWSISPSHAGSVASGQRSSNVTIQWNNYNGWATITLVRTVCGQSVTSTKMVNLNLPPTPVINPLTPACQDMSKSFSTPTTASSYHWNFGDGNTSSLQNPTHTYTTPGNKTVTLTVTYTGSCSVTRSVTATIMVYPKPNVSISTPDPNIFCGTISTVNMFVSGPVTGSTYNWYRSPSTLVSANATSYSTNVLGNYYVIATDANGCQGTSNNIRIDTSCSTCTPNPAYSVDFTRYRLGCNTDSFIGTYTPGATNPVWYWDDPYSTPSTYSGNPAVHQFKEPGYYRVRLCVQVPNISGTGFCTKCVSKVDTIKYVPNFYDSLYCVNGQDSVRAKFINNTKWLTSLPMPSYVWTVSPGGYTSTAMSPTFTLGAGTYTVNLNVGGVCNFSKTFTFPAAPHASFTSLDSICVNAGMTFNNTSTGTYNGAFWSFGDGASLISMDSQVVRVYSNPGVYYPSLTVTNSYGCTNTITNRVIVVPNSLRVNIASNGSAICEGDSVLIASGVSGGYPTYGYLWNTIQNTPNIWAKYTSTYLLDVTDSKLCFAKSNGVNILVNAQPKPEITGKTNLCLDNNYTFGVNYPSPTYTIQWKLDGGAPITGGSTYPFYAGLPTVGTHQLVVKVTSASGCVGTDTIVFTVHHNPTANISTSGGPLCEGNANVLTGSSPSPGIVTSYWNNGSSTNPIVAMAAGYYSYTVVDVNGCKATNGLEVYPLPDFCGMLTGCYDICDTVSDLIWYAPAGYATYQWYFNGTPIPGATSQQYHIPLYQSGSYSVELSSYIGCKAMSDRIEINFVKCESCLLKAKLAKIYCAPVDSVGNPRYYITMDIDNPFGPGAALTIATTGGVITNLSTPILAGGNNTVTFTYTDIAPLGPNACFSVYVTNEDGKQCDTVICVRLPRCNRDCEARIRIKSIECAGLDPAGNPIYNFCVDVDWGGSNGSLLTVYTSSGTFVPVPATINTGSQLICFAYTDLPPHSTHGVFYFSIYDPEKETNCLDSIKAEYKRCEEPCNLSIHGLCTFCNKLNDDGSITYKIGVTLYNPFGSATVSVLPISSGTFGTITPNPIPSGMQQFFIYFTDNLPQDTIICFRVILSDGGKTCWQDICVYLPPCNGEYLNEDMRKTISSSINVTPNPAQHNFTVFYTVPTEYNNELNIEVLDVTGRVVQMVSIDNMNGKYTFENLTLQPGIYYVNVKGKGELLGFKRIVIIR